jgi:hypothetical protein
VLWLLQELEQTCSELQAFEVAACAAGNSAIVRQPEVASSAPHGSRLALTPSAAFSQVWVKCSCCFPWCPATRAHRPACQSLRCSSALWQVFRRSEASDQSRRSALPLDRRPRSVIMLMRPRFKSLWQKTYPYRPPAPVGLSAKSAHHEICRSCCAKPTRNTRQRCSPCSAGATIQRA